MGRGPAPSSVRSDVHNRMARLHRPRNRVAHHEPIHNRDLASDWQALVAIAGWICPDTRKWIVASSRTMKILTQRRAIL